MTETCDVCQQAWAVRFEWDYTDAEQYCLEHILEPIDTQSGKVLLAFMPDCPKITHRLTQHGRQVTYRSLAAVYPVLTGRLATW